MPKDLLFEIGTEEIPSTYLSDLLSQLEINTRNILSESRIRFSEVIVCGTPRRLVAHVRNIDESQEPYTEEILGPPARIGFDVDGEPTKATLSFLKKNQMELSDLKKKETPKGERLFLEHSHDSSETIEVLSSSLISIISTLSSPKSMRWQKGNFYFVRPIRWILALYGGEVIPLELKLKEHKEIASLLPEFNNFTYGHRFLSNGPIEVKNFEDYIEKLNKNFVNIISAKEKSESRFQFIKEEVLKAALELGTVPALDDEGFQFLVEKVSNLVEWPKIIQCNFDEKYLEIPEEVIVNTLESNQRFFALRDENTGNIKAKFVAVSNIETEDMGVIRNGYERVVQARLEDAEFYWEKDLTVSLEDMSKKLKDVIYHPKLGTSMEKVHRFSLISSNICKEFYPQEKEMHKNVMEISNLCKADLTSGMVYEFPELQGVIGKYFAEIQGKNKKISSAIYEHYLPVREGDPVPSTLEGSIVSLSDRFDTVIGLIGLNYVPKGSEDPYALRRTTSGIFKILSSTGMKLNLSETIEKSLAIFGDIFSKDKDQILDRLHNFFENRVHAYLMQNSNRSDLIESVLVASKGRTWQLPTEALAKLKLVQEIVDEEDFNGCASIYKRVFNITKKDAFLSKEIEGNDFGFEKIDSSLFVNEEERSLYNELDVSIQKSISILDAFQSSKICSVPQIKEEFKKIYETMCTLIIPIDNFFDNVLIMEEDKTIRENRIVMLRVIRRFFSLICDFTKINN
ncbi:MAG: glycine--tRNA ligase subunit beta [Nitrospinota bacterium]|nr:glycine--tRNA ligase subunit beta [Nitrospinota bacterium]